MPPYTHPLHSLSERQKKKNNQKEEEEEWGDSAGCDCKHQKSVVKGVLTQKSSSLDNNISALQLYGGIVLKKYDIFNG